MTLRLLGPGTGLSRPDRVARTLLVGEGYNRLSLPLLDTRTRYRNSRSFRGTGRPRGVQVNPAMTTTQLQAAINAAGVGGTVVWSPGIYRVTAILVPLTNQTWTGLGGREAIISGCKLVPSWASEGNYWTSTGHTTVGTSLLTDANGNDRGSRPVRGVAPQGMHAQKDMLFADGLQLWQHPSLVLLDGGVIPVDHNQLYAGGFFFSGGKLWVRKDQVDVNLSTMEMCQRSGAGVEATDNTGITLHNLVIRGFGTNARQSALHVGQGALIEDCEISNNHGAGVRHRSDSIIRGCYIAYNGHLGIHGTGPGEAFNQVFEDSHLFFNNCAGYNWSFEAGGTKWVHTHGLRVRRNRVEGAVGMGVWTDGTVDGTIWEHNTVIDNETQGIDMELGSDGPGTTTICRFNYCRGNGYGHGQTGFGGGITNLNSPLCEVYGNVVEFNQAGITGVEDGRGVAAGLSDYFVHDNIIRQRSNAVDAPSWSTSVVTNTAAGIRVLTSPRNPYSVAANNDWRSNTYVLDGLTLPRFIWSFGTDDRTAWQGAGQDPAPSTFQTF